MNPNTQSELFTAYRYHAVFTDSPLPMLEAEKAHRAHAIVEQVIADLKNGPLAHLQSGHFWANSAWLVCAAIAFNLTRAAGALASASHARATTGTIPRAAHHRPGAARPLSPSADHAPADSLALAAGVGAAGHNREQPTGPCLTTHSPVRQDPTGHSSGDQPARPAISPCPQQADSKITPPNMITEGSTVDPS